MLVKDSVNLSIKGTGVMWGLCVFSFSHFSLFFFFSPERVQITIVCSEAETLT